MTSAPTLVILAAGLGRRYGGLKQLEPVGPGGATLMDYSIYDARRAGFRQVVFVIRPEMEAAVRETLVARYAPHLPVVLALQRMDEVPPDIPVSVDRTRPWGTAHAVLSAAACVSGPLAVINADDFYGGAAFAALAEFLRAIPVSVGAATWAMVGYCLRDTLSETGAVARAVCQCTPDGWLQRIEEVTGLTRCGADAQSADEEGTPRIVSGDTRVSMNLWGFTPAVFEVLRTGFHDFLLSYGTSPTAECYLPHVVQAAVAAGRARVRVLPGGDTWCGVTHPADRARAAAVLADRVAAGAYPKDPWGAR